MIKIHFKAFKLYFDYYCLEKGYAFDSLRRHNSCCKSHFGIVKERYKKWLFPIEKEMKRNRTFIIIGAGHIGGANGLIELLKMKHYTVIPIYV